ncbi:copper resistance protein CopC [Nocardiopsis sp. HNM0947]|uniref:Copper resistance protein CopC n=1 Tax=Nocardiopsis coralli TaxID=2772213 RepID=A0ABR9P8W9_9ACTN|nr:copper resistance CopC family protein [Nocardiopsis coralli]MBE3000293.1 copper resistance protein CopC [Nocardiopsis coralli]
MTTPNTTARAAALALAPFTAAALVLAPAPALAHDVLISSSPEDGESLDTVPEEVVLTFNNNPLETGDGNAIAVTGPDEETTYETGGLEFDGADVTTELEPLDEAGDYTIGYRIVSSDGHPIQETLTFSVSEEAVAAAAPEEDEDAQEDDAAEEEAAEENADDAAEETGAEEAADEGGISGTTVAVIVVAAVVVLAAVILIAVRMRKSTQ